MSTLIQRNFSGGELSPALYSRTDTTKYAAGLRTLRNFFVKKDGGASNRHGTNYRAETNENKKSRIIEFKVSGDLCLGIEFTDQKIRILRGGVPVYTPGLGLSITFMSNASTCIVTYSGINPDPVNGQEIYLFGPQTGELRDGIYKVQNVDTVAKTFELWYLNGTPVDSFYMSLSGGGVLYPVVNITSPYLEADIPFIDYAQSVSTMTLVHPLYAPRKLVMTTYPEGFSLNTAVYGVLPAPQFINASAGQAGTTGATVINYGVTSIDPASGLESGIVPFSIANGNATTTPTNYVGINFQPSGVGVTYNIYRLVYGVYGLIGVAKSVSTVLAEQFRDIGVQPDTTQGVTTPLNPFSGAGNYPSCVTYFQQRIWYGNTINKPETVWGSVSGSYDSFIKRSPGDPIRSTDSVEFNLAGRTLNPVRFLLDLAALIMFTEESEWSLNGSSGAISPSDINTQQQSYNGTRRGLRPLVIDNTAVYVQNLGSILRELGFQFQSDGYRGDDLTTFSAHLFEGHVIVDWCYQKNPDSIIWAVRNDGILLSLTHIKEQAILGWAHHDFDGGFVEGVACIRELTEDVVYVTVRRVIGEKTVRHIEKLVDRNIKTLDDCKFVDDHLTYNGENTQNNFFRIQDPSNNWDYQTEMMINSITPLVSFPLNNARIGNQIHIRFGDEEIRFTISRIDLIANPYGFYGYPNRTVPVAARNITTGNWAYAVKKITGLQHLAGQKVSIYADGNVVGSVYNPNVSEYTVSSTSEIVDDLLLPVGSVVLDKHYVRVVVGKPITADVETLDIDTAQGETLMDKQKNVSRVTMRVDRSRGIFVGPKLPPADNPLKDMAEAKTRNLEGYDDPTKLLSGVVSVDIFSQWNSNGRVFVRQIDPLPLTILAIAPAGLLPFKG